MLPVARPLQRIDAKKSRLVKLVPRILNEVGSKNNILLRGHAAIISEVKPLIGRHYNGDWDRVLKKEKIALEHFKKKSIPHLRTKPDNDLDWLCLMQHYGCPTRLLDFTTNPLVALFFASDPGNEGDGEVLVVDANSVQPASGSNDNVFENKLPFFYHPSHQCERVIGQMSCFLVCPNPNKGLEIAALRKVLVPSAQKEEFRRELTILGISHSQLFPGLEGICKDLNDVLCHGLDEQALFDQFPHLL